MISKLKPTMRTDSKRTPVSTIDANSSRARTFFCSSVSRAKSSGTFESVTSSSGRTWPSPISPGTSVSGSMIRFNDAVERRSMRWSTGVAGRSLVSVVVVSMPEAIPTFFIISGIASIPYFL